MKASYGISYHPWPKKRQSRVVRRSGPAFLLPVVGSRASLGFRDVGLAGFRSCRGLSVVSGCCPSVGLQALWFATSLIGDL